MDRHWSWEFQVRGLRQVTLKRIYVPTNIWQSNELFCIVMQQTVTQEITYPGTSKFDNLRPLVPTNKHGSNVLEGKQDA